MTDTFVLRNDGSFVLRNDGSKIIRNGIVAVVVTTPEKSISHVTLDAGEDLRKHKRERQLQKLALSIEIPVFGLPTKRERLSIECEGACKIPQKISITPSIPIVQRHRIPLDIPVFSTQKTLFAVVGEKGYNRVMKKTIQDYQRKDKIDTLKEALRMLDE